MANAVAHILIREKAIDEQTLEECCHGYELYREHILKYPPGLAVKECDLSHGEVEHLAEIFAQETGRTQADSFEDLFGVEVEGSKKP